MADCRGVVSCTLRALPRRGGLPTHGVGLRSLEGADARLDAGQAAGERVDVGLEREVGLDGLAVGLRREGGHVGLGGERVLDRLGVGLAGEGSLEVDDAGQRVAGLLAGLPDADVRGLEAALHTGQALGERGVGRGELPADELELVGHGVRLCVLRVLDLLAEDLDLLHHLRAGGVGEGQERDGADQDETEHAEQGLSGAGHVTSYVTHLRTYGSNHLFSIRNPHLGSISSFRRSKIQSKTV